MLVKEWQSAREIQLGFSYLDIVVINVGCTVPDYAWLGDPQEAGAGDNLSVEAGSPAIIFIFNIFFLRGV